jgi:hypothetical protein
MNALFFIRVYRCRGGRYRVAISVVPLTAFSRLPLASRRSVIDFSINFPQVFQRRVQD